MKFEEYKSCCSFCAPLAVAARNTEIKMENMDMLEGVGGRMNSAQDEMILIFVFFSLS